MHLIPLLGDKRLDTIQTEDVQHVKAVLVHRSTKTVNNVLTVFSVMLRTAVDWGVISRAMHDQLVEDGEERSGLL